MRNIVFWAKENPHFMIALEHNPPYMILSVGETVTCMTGPPDRPVKTALYKVMLKAWLIPELGARTKMNNLWLQHDGAPTHFTSDVCNILNVHVR
jgi:hypothetical protein